MSTSTLPPTKQPAHFTLEVREPREAQPTGVILAAYVENPHQVFSADFSHEHPLDEALENLLNWANGLIDTSTHEVELVIWNKDTFARLTPDLKWFSLNTTCFISYYAALMCLPAQQARLSLMANNLSVTGWDRPKMMAKMFKENLLPLSQAIRGLRVIWGIATPEFPKSA